jgi:hypothetical protein
VAFQFEYLMRPLAYLNGRFSARKRLWHCLDSAISGHSMLSIRHLERYSQFSIESEKLGYLRLSLYRC